MDCSCDEFTAYMRVRLTAIGVNRSARPALTAQRKPLRIRAAADNATGTEAGLTDKKDLQGDILFKPFDEVKSELTAVEKADMNGQPIEDSFARVGYAQDAEYAVNEQVNIEYNMSYVYHAMSAYFDRDNVALPGLASYFRAASEEEREHAQTLMDFQAVRGGRTKLAHLTAPQADYNHEEKGDALHAMELALSLEKLNFHKLRELHDVADATKDAQMADFVETMLAEQAKGVKIVADYVAQLRRIGKGHGVFHFDQVMAQDAARLATPSTTY
ncbi:hypothetical protein ABBQ38_012497 [Trebouxia sp. C0009 RCD-2024]